MYYTVYKTTNQVNGKFYIGAHKTVDLDDDYIGSGTLLKRAIEKHGIENFKKEILFVFDNPEGMFSKEAEIVTEDFLAEENTYNLKVGGFGGFDFLNSKRYNNPTHSSEHLYKMASKRIEKYPLGTMHGKNLNNLAKEKISRAKKGNKYWLGKTHTQTAKDKISAANSIAQQGQKNSQYGTCWITDGASNKKIKKQDAIPEGWQLGRKIK